MDRYDPRSLDDTEYEPRTSLWTIAMLAGMAGGLAWGIRGQYGHETGEMIAGVLLGFTLTLLLGGRLSSLATARAIALFALGISIGGSMTYGQTVGLTHDGPLVGNWAALRWGMLGLAIKGGVWFGLGAAMFGMGLSGKRYAPREMLLLFAIMMVALFIGVYLLNRPFDVQNKQLPHLYFSDHWYWEEDVDKPRRERWGGLLFALAALLIYLGAWKRDWLAFSLGLWGLLGGAIGFPAGQAIQAFSAWNRDWLAQLPTHAITQFFNWWNMMETTFGFVAGATLGCGLWWHRDWIDGEEDEDPEEDSIRCSPLLEWLIVAFYIRALVAWNFQSIPAVDLVADLALPVIIIPAIVVMSGRYMPYLISLPIVLLPIAGKTVRQLVYQEQWIDLELGWDLLCFGPLVLAATLAIGFARKSQTSKSALGLTSVGLVATTWLYFGLNFAFFHLPWPWREWTGRTPNGIIFMIFAVCLTIAAVWKILQALAFDSSENEVEP